MVFQHVCDPVRPWNVSVPVLVTALLAGILVLYVFIGGRGGRAEALPHCSSDQALALVKREIVDRAAGLRGGTDHGFAQIANYSVLRSPSTLVRRIYAGKDEVGCSGTLVLDLPPGVAAADGRHSLAAQISYQLKQGAGGIVQLDGLTNAEAIASPLAGVAQTAQVAPPPASVPSAAAQPGSSAQPSPSPPPPRPPASGSAQPEQTHPTTRAPPPQQAPAQRSEPPKTQHPSAPEPRPSGTQSASPKPPPQTARPVAIARSGPSFDCRSAHSRGEMVVCSNPPLAALDDQMAQQFHRAMAAARPGQRDMLRRTGRRFIRYRDSCPSIACMTDAYRGRMREISDIMTGPW
jgi:uncharacterized protein YecT (DUF1311 family)